MSSPLMPPFDSLQDRKFSFYPPIVNVEHNEWTVEEATWSEVKVQNTRGGEPVWIARRLFGEVSKVDDPVVIVGLKKELELKSGTVWPYERRVLSMQGPSKARPRDEAAPEAPKGFGHILGHETQGTESRIGRMIGVSLGTLLVAVVAVWAVMKFAPQARVTFSAKDQAYLDLSRGDDYFAVVRKLGTPNEDVYRANTSEIQYRRLTYTNRGYHVILMGTERNSVRYIGTLSKDWRALHYIQYPNGTDSSGMMRTMIKF